MSEAHPSSFPTALICDTSFLRTIGGTDSTTYQTFIQYVQKTDRELYLSPGVIEELTEQRGYISIDWVDRAATTEWITSVKDVQLGVRVHDGPRAGEVQSVSKHHLQNHLNFLALKLNSSGNWFKKLVQEHLC
jgi:hypothetical protein